MKFFVFVTKGMIKDIQIAFTFFFYKIQTINIKFVIDINGKICLQGMTVKIFQVNLF